MSCPNYKPHACCDVGMGEKGNKRKEEDRYRGEFLGVGEMKEENKKVSSQLPCILKATL